MNKIKVEGTPNLFICSLLKASPALSLGEKKKEKFTDKKLNSMPKICRTGEFDGFDN